MSFDVSVVINNLPLLLEGALVTIKITAIAVALGFFIGLIAALANLSRFWLIRALSKIYVGVIRGTPLLVQIFIIYFAIPTIINRPIDPFLASIIACSVNSGAYVAEIFRAGLQSVDKGQMEAGRSLGLSWSQTMRSIIIPQAVKNVLPAMGNEFIAMLKDSSLVSTIGFEELMREGQLIIARTYQPMEIWTAVAIIYLIMTQTISQIVYYVERRNKVA